MFFIKIDYCNSTYKNISPVFCVMLLLPPRNLNRCVKIKQVLNFISTIGLIAPIKNFKQNIGENIVQCWFYETGIKILRQISKAPLPLLLISRQNSNVDFVKTNTGINYYVINFVRYCQKVYKNQSTLKAHIFQYHKEKPEGQRVFNQTLGGYYR